ncbi:MAG: YraN family protein [Clostridia bacterium]
MGKDTELLNNKILGNLGERIAKIYLQMNNFQIIKCNFRSRFGEIDIIAKKHEYIHFIEVKTRTKNTIEAREAIDKNKEKHIWKTAEYFLYINRIEDIGIEFDAIEVYIEKNQWIINYIPENIEK